ncbi:MAG TPA: EpsI family protein [Longimicrobiaceae bacterium]
MSPRLRTWAPAVVLAAGLALTAATSRDVSMPLRAPLARTVPLQVGPWSGRDLPIGDAERAVAGMDDYLYRRFAASPGAATAFTLYVGYYRSQAQGRTIHSPKNCLPGAGWEVLSSSAVPVRTATGTVTVNRALLQRKGDRAVVLYWYQGRGRVAADEYRVKWDLLRDAAFHGRTEESLVRVMVPVGAGGQAEADRVALLAARAAVPAVERALPARG